MTYMTRSLSNMRDVWLVPGGYTTHMVVSSSSPKKWTDTATS